MIPTITFDDVKQAETRLAGAVRRTPLVENDALNSRVGKRVLVKLECLQHTGSFKWRGGWNSVKALVESGSKQGVIAYSSGNHAQGVSRAAKLLGVPAVIVMPSDAPPIKINNTRGYGAEVVLYDRPGGEDREKIGETIANERGLTLIRPYDEVNVVAGQGTCGLEIAEQARVAGVEEAPVLVCCGGGGLTSGIALAFSALAPGLTAYPVEPTLADDVCRSLESGKREQLIGVPDTVCDAIITPSPGEITFPILKQHCPRGFAVDDDAVAEAVRLAFTELKVVAEPGGAAALAAVLTQGATLPGDAIIAVITGGNVDPTWLASILNYPAIVIILLAFGCLDQGSQTVPGGCCAGSCVCAGVLCRCVDCVLGHRDLLSAAVDLVTELGDTARFYDQIKRLKPKSQ